MYNYSTAVLPKPEKKKIEKKVNRGRIEEMPSRENISCSRLKFYEKTDKIVLRKKSALLHPYFQRAFS